MRRTNSKEARRAAEAYAMEEARDVLERCDAVDALRPVHTAFEIMRDEVRYQTDDRNGRSVIGIGIARKYREAGRTFRAAVANDPYNVWQLAAAAGCFECYYDGARDRVAEWLDQTPEEAARYGNDEVWNLYTHLSAAAFDRIHSKENDPHVVRVSEFFGTWEE